MKITKIKDNEYIVDMENAVIFSNVPTAICNGSPEIIVQNGNFVNIHNKDIEACFKDGVFKNCRCLDSSIFPKNILKKIVKYFFK
jgi:hypothetical protein